MKLPQQEEEIRTLLPRGSSLCEGMGEGYCTQPYPCICKEAVSRFESMTNKSPRHNFTTAPGLALQEEETIKKQNIFGVSGDFSHYHELGFHGFKFLILDYLAGASL